MATDVPVGGKAVDHPNGRRRLEFGSQQFRGKTFFMDINGYPREKEIKEELIARGATIQDYLDKNVRYLVTTRDKEQIKKAREAYASSGQSPNTPSTGGQSQLFSPATGSNRSPVDQKLPPYHYHTRRGYQILQIAKGNLQGKKADILVTACSWKCKIIHVKEVEKEIKRLKPVSRRSDSHVTCSKSNPKVRQLRVPFFKAVDINHQYRPIVFEPRQWPVLNLMCPSNCSPFDLPKPGGVEVQAAKGGDNKITEKAEYEKKAGFCECCSTRYEDLRKHLCSSQHQRYADNAENYRTLDKLISHGPSFDDVVASLKLQQQQHQLKSPSKSPKKSELHPCGAGQDTCEPSRPAVIQPQDLNSVTAYNPEREEILLVSLPSSAHPTSEEHISENINTSPKVSEVYNMLTKSCDMDLSKVKSPVHSLCSTPVRMELCLTKVKSPVKPGQLTPVRKRRTESLHSEHTPKRLCPSENES